MSSKKVIAECDTSDEIMNLVMPKPGGDGSGDHAGNVEGDNECDAIAASAGRVEPIEGDHANNGDNVMETGGDNGIEPIGTPGSLNSIKHFSHSRGLMMFDDETDDEIIDKNGFESESDPEIRMEKAKAYAFNLLSQGKRNIALKDYSGAVNLLGSACNQLVKIFGTFGIECADAYYHYGCACLELGKEEDGFPQQQSGPIELTKKAEKKKDNIPAGNGKNTANGEASQHNTEKVAVKNDDVKSVKDKGDDVKSVKDKGDDVKSVKDKGDDVKRAKDKGDDVKRAKDKGDDVKRAKDKGDDKSVKDKGNDVKSVKDKGNVKSVKDKGNDVKSVKDKGNVKSAKDKDGDVKSAKDKGDDKSVKYKGDDVKSVKDKGDDVTSGEDKSGDVKSVTKSDDGKSVKDGNNDVASVEEETEGASSVKGKHDDVKHDNSDGKGESDDVTSVKNESDDDNDDDDGDEEDSDISIKDNSDDSYSGTEDDVGYYQLAWESLECAKQIFSSKNNQLRLADCLFKLTEVSLVAGNFEIALKDVKSGIRLFESIKKLDKHIIKRKAFQRHLKSSILALRRSQSVMNIQMSIVETTADETEMEGIKKYLLKVANKLKKMLIISMKKKTVRTLKGSDRSNNTVGGAVGTSDANSSVADSGHLERKKAVKRSSSDRKLEDYGGVIKKTCLDDDKKNDTLDNGKKNGTLDNDKKNDTLDNDKKNDTLDDDKKNDTLDNDKKNDTLDNDKKHDTLDKDKKNDTLDNDANNGDNGHNTTDDEDSDNSGDENCSDYNCDAYIEKEDDSNDDDDEEEKD